jgi:transketolase N-terminal domain/subunit
MTVAAARSRGKGIAHGARVTMGGLHYQLSNLITIVDVNRLRQRGETEFG